MKNSIKAKKIYEKLLRKGFGMISKEDEIFTFNHIHTISKKDEIRARNLRNKMEYLFHLDHPRKHFDSISFELWTESLGGK